MQTGNWTYMLILGLSLAYPLAQSFERRVYMYRKFPYLMPGILITGAIYLAWDVFFTRLGIWGFNHDYVLGFSIARLPIEEWLFFLVVPWACFFIYEVLRHFVKSFYFPRLSLGFLLTLLFLFLALIPFNLHHTYTLAALGFTSLMLAVAWISGSHKKWLPGFFLTYLVSLLPFILVNGFLTSLPVVWYNDSQNLGIRIWTIPVEDFIYLLGLLLSIQLIYQRRLKRHAPATLKADMKFNMRTGF